MSSTHLFVKLDGKLQRWEYAGDDPLLGRQELLKVLRRQDFMKVSPVLALIRGGKA